MRPASARSLTVLVIAVCALAVSFFHVAHAAVHVQVEGLAAIIPGEDLAKSRDEALRDACRRAVEVGVGLVLRTESLASNLQLISDTIWTASSGYVRTYQVLSETKDKDFYRVTVSAEVDMLKVGEALSDLGIEIDRIGNPRAVVAVEEWTSGTRQPFSLAEGVLREALVKKGFVVLDRARLDELRDPDQLLRATQGDAGAAREIARALDADLSIVGSVRADPSGSTQIGQFMWQAATAYATVTAVLRDTGEILSSALRKESALELTVETAQSEAVRKVAEACVPQLIIETVAGLNYASPDALRALKLIARGVKTYDQADALKEALRKLREAVQVDLRSFGESLASFDVIFQGPAEALARKIESRSFAATLRELLGRAATVVVRSVGFGTVQFDLKVR